MNDKQISLIPPQAILDLEQRALIGYESNGHSLISPSGASRWAKCVGSLIGLHHHRRTAPDNPASIEGTVAHWLLELALLHETHPKNITKNTIGELTDSQYNEVQGWFKRIIDNPNQTPGTIDTAIEMQHVLIELEFPHVMREYVGGVFDKIMEYQQQGYKVYPELRVSLKKYFGHSQCDGSVDVPMVKGSHMIIADLKYGVVEAVYPEHNKQLSLYGVGACVAFEEQFGIQIETIDIVICQPRIADRVWDSWSTNKADLLIFAAEMKIASIKALMAIADPTSVTEEMYAPGETTCTYCHRKIDCKSRKSMALDKAKEAFTIGGSNLTVDGSARKAPEPPAVESITDDDLATIMNYAPFILSYLRDVEKEVFRRVQRGKNVGGRKLVKGRLSRTWSVPEDQLDRMIDQLGIDPDQFYEKKLISPAKFDKVDVPPHVRVVIESLVKKAYGQPVVALQDDRRETIKVTSAKDEFTKSWSK